MGLDGEADPDGGRREREPHVLLHQQHREPPRATRARIVSSISATTDG
jgi:hypothetical protein